MGKPKKKPALSFLGWALSLIMIFMVSALVGSLIICGQSFEYLAHQKPQDYALKQTNLILQAIESHPGRAMLANLPSDLHFGTQQCWDFLQIAMSQNANQYTTAVVGMIGSLDRPEESGVVSEVVVHVVFSDKKRAELHYRNDILRSCRELP